MASYTRLTLGSRGDEVRRLQTRLNQYGANLAVDGVFGNQTLAAVKKYQSAHGLASDGVVGDLTWGRLLGGGVTPQPTPVTPAVTTTAAYRRSGVSDETARALAAFEKGYTPSAAVNQAAEALRRLQSQRPGDYQSPYGERLEAMLTAIRERKPFSYDLNADLLYRQYRDQYTALGRQAMDDTVGRAAALTGGYGSSYGQSVGQQAYDGYLQQLNSKVPELYRLALERYNAEGDRMATEYAALEDREQDAYNRWRDAVSGWESRLSAAQRSYETERDFDYDRWADAWKYWQGRSDDEYAAWRQETAAAAAAAASAARGSGSSRSGGGKSAKSTRSSGAGKSGKTGKSGAGKSEVLVHIPGYGHVTMSDARAMAAAGVIDWVMKDNRRSFYTDGEGNYVARMRKAPVKGPFRMVK